MRSLSAIPQTILLIDDDTFARKSMALFLEDLDYRVLEAYNGRDGLELFFREQPDLVLTDLDMPVLDGFGVVGRLAQECPETPVVVVSGVNDVQEAIRAIQLGAWDYICKPIQHVDELTIIIERMLERARLLRENRDYHQNLEKLVEERTQQVHSSQSKLIQAHKLASIGMLASGIAHEINNPNNYIAFNSDLMAEIWSDALPVLDVYAKEHPLFTMGGLPFEEIPGTTSRLLGGLADGSRRISAIVSQLNQYARPGLISGDGFDINKTVINAVALLDHYIRHRTDAFNIQLAEQLPPAQGVSQQIEQVLINLITNAVQALTGRSQAVVVSTFKDEQTGELVIMVTDQGQGMTQDTLARLKEPFFSTRHGSGGTGLGLSISDDIIQEHGGSLQFESEPGKGTLASIRLKVAETLR
jgi:signal transduction histidine kinase